MEQPYLMKGRGIGSDHRAARYGHGGRGTLLQVENPILDSNVDWQPLAPDYITDNNNATLFKRETIVIPL